MPPRSSAIHAMEDRLLAHLGSDDRHALRGLLERALDAPARPTDAIAHSRPRTAHRSGNSGVNRVLRRYAAPEDPPVPDLSPIVRSTIFTWR